MKNNFTFIKNAAAFSKKIAILMAIFFYTGTAFAQQVNLSLVTGYEVEVNAGPTICEPSGATIQYFPGGAFYTVWPSLSVFPSNRAAYYTVEAGKTSTIKVDIPTVGWLSGENGFTFYSYGMPGYQNFPKVAYAVSNSPAGFIRFEFPVTFPIGAEKAFYNFWIRDKLNSDPVSYLVSIPITVLGPTTLEVPILGTTADPQIPDLI